MFCSVRTLTGSREELDTSEGEAKAYIGLYIIYPFLSRPTFTVFIGTRIASVMCSQALRTPCSRLLGLEFVSSL